MKLKFLHLPVIILLLSFKTFSPETWKLDTVHSSLGFSVPHLSVSEITGTIKLIEATITTTGEKFSDARISLKADMKSIDTDNDKRDAHLNSADFFDSEKFPEIIFESTSCKSAGSDNYIITGNLTFHGITKLITLNAAVKSGINPVNDKPISGFKVSGTIKRSDFNIATTTPEAILGDEVTIIANLEFGIKKD